MKLAIVFSGCLVRPLVSLTGVTIASPGDMVRHLASADVNPNGGTFGWAILGEVFDPGPERLDRLFAYGVLRVVSPRFWGIRLTGADDLYSPKLGLPAHMLGGNVAIDVAPLAECRWFR